MIFKSKIYLKIILIVAITLTQDLSRIFLGIRTLPITTTMLGTGMIFPAANRIYRVIMKLIGCIILDKVKK